MKFIYGIQFAGCRWIIHIPMTAVFVFMESNIRRNPLCRREKKSFILATDPTLRKLLTKFNVKDSSHANNKLLFLLTRWNFSRCTFDKVHSKLMNNFFTLQFTYVNMTYNFFSKEIILRKIKFFKTRFTCFENWVENVKNIESKSEKS